MLRIAVAAFVLAVTGCASTSSGAAAAGRGGNATVTGSITYPESGLQGDPCSSVNVKVTEGNSAALGSGEVKRSRKQHLQLHRGEPAGRRGPEGGAGGGRGPEVRQRRGAHGHPGAHDGEVARFGAKVISYKLSCG